jgi:hypothetical protein
MTPLQEAGPAPHSWKSGGPRAGGLLENAILPIYAAGRLPSD